MSFSSNDPASETVVRIHRTAENQQRNSRRGLSAVGSPLLMCCSLLMLYGCDDEKPYTPFEVASSLPGETQAPKSDGKENPPEKKRKKNPKSQLPPASSETRWKAFDRTLIAPTGTRFAVALEDPTEESDLVIAWVFGAGRKAAVENSGLWAFNKAGRPARHLVKFPEFLPQGEDCRPNATLSATGSQTVSASLAPACSTPVLEGTPTASHIVLAPAHDSPVVLHLSQSDSLKGEQLSVTLDSSDTDDDGIDDVTLTAELKAPSGTKASLPFRWLVRTAGASRESGSPGRELAKQTSRLLISSVRKAERGDAPAKVDALRRLLTAICSELGRPQLKRASGDPLPCGKLDKELGQLAQVNVQSFLGEKQQIRALGAYEQAEWFGKTPQIPPDLERKLTEKIPQYPARKLARFRVDVKSSSGPYGTPLTFDDSGQLWAVTAEKTKRLTMEGDPPLLTPATEDEPERRIEPPKWSIDVKDSSDSSLVAALPSCDRSEVVLALSGGKAASTPLQILAPRPGQCSGFAPTPLPAEPLSGSGGAFAVVVAGEIQYSRGAYRPLARPVAYNTSLGLAVVDGTKVSLWTGELTNGLHHCSVNPEVSKVACVGTSGVTVLAADGQDDPSEAK